MTSREEERLKQREERNKERKRQREERLREREERSQKRGNKQSGGNQHEQRPQVRQKKGIDLPPDYFAIKKESISKVQNEQLIQLAKQAQSFYDLYYKVKSDPNLKVEFLYLVGLMTKTELRRFNTIDRMQLGENELKSEMQFVNQHRTVSQLNKELNQKYLYVYGNKHVYEYVKALELPGIVKKVEDIGDFNPNSTILIFGKGNNLDALQTAIQKQHLHFLIIKEKNVLSVSRSEFIRRVNHVWQV